MDFRTSEIVQQNFAKVSPYQPIRNLEGRSEIFQKWQNRIWGIWAVPIALTFAEIVYLKHGKVPLANKVSLFKWISYILALCASNFSSAEAIRKGEFYHRLYPNLPQIQREQIRDAEIIKRTVAI